MLIHRAIRALAGLALLVSAGAAEAACYDPRQALPAETVSGFVADPAGLLSRHPDGGAQLISQVRDLVASDPATLQPVVGLLGSANGNQQSAIGSGLGQAYRICLRPDQAFATQIQLAVAGSASNPAKDAYALINPDTAIGAAGGAGGSAGTGIGGATGSTSSSVGPFGAALANNATDNPGNNLTSGMTISSAGGLSTSTTTVSGQ
ncbi:hypothetical protein PQJ75_08295 [Rhodoplanes sp. TEM]|uniref:Uncharacterized protein n=1 Tax=Rhodoplanes tepidamans TaxID=200616 RepID=A0ABT5JAK7_RHOTP|nr:MULTISPECIES: hypothetical protein [Rhodoplanes]MDC7786720.1 hypothetical protein [Rhodoplanes tepidamans]MDC7983726.1 hypothetical protein [Rhodoplanes sp. TEM]MDQ0358156.1 hypothetical protein [Rhodoplanes tepidamans]